MEEGLTFENFKVGVDSVYSIGEVPKRGDEFPRPGVIEEIGYAFDYQGDDLNGLIEEVAPHTTLQDNIGHIKDVLSDLAVIRKIGHADKTAIEIARDWGERSGLQKQVYRPLMEPHYYMPGGFAAAVVTDGVVNWMNRTADIAERVGRGVDIPLVLLVSGGRRIGSDEHPDVEAGTPSKDYMSEVLEPRLKAAGSFATVKTIGIEDEEGQTVMDRAASYLMEEGFDLTQARIVVPAVAGNWMQKGAQARQALKKVEDSFDEDNPQSTYSRQLWVASDSLPLGITGEESKETHQNPFSAVGNIVRGAKLLDEI